MSKKQLNVDALQVTTFEIVETRASEAQPVQRTGATGFCNSCWACDWTV
jgi:hypothetical protein